MRVKIEAEARLEEGICGPGCVVVSAAEHPTFFVVPASWVTELPEEIAVGTPCAFWDGDEEPQTPYLARYAERASTGVHVSSGSSWGYMHARPLTVDDLRRDPGSQKP